MSQTAKLSAEGAPARGGRALVGDAVAAVEAGPHGAGDLVPVVDLVVAGRATAEERRVQLEGEDEGDNTERGEDEAGLAAGPDDVATSGATVDGETTRPSV